MALTHSPQTGTVGTSNSFSINKGTAAADRYIVLAVSYRLNTGSADTINTLALDGVTFSKITGTAAQNGLKSEVWISDAPVPSGTTGTLTITRASGTGWFVTVAPTALYGAEPVPVAFNNSVQSGGTSHGISATVPTGGVVVIAGAHGDQSNAGSWTNATSHHSADATQFRGEAAYSTTAGAATRTLNASGGEFFTLAYVAFAELVADDFPDVVAASTGRTSTTDTTSHPITLPADIPVGARIVVIFAVDGNPTISINTGVSGSNWSIISEAANASAVRGAVVSKIAEGSDVLTLTTSASEQSSHVVVVVDDAGDIEAANANGSSTNSNPPSLTPSWGSDDDLWLVGRAGDSTVQPTAPPANFAGLVSIAAAGTGGASAAIAQRKHTNTVLDPGTFTSATEQWVAFTIAIRPASVAAAEASLDLTEAGESLSALADSGEAIATLDLTEAAESLSAAASSTVAGSLDLTEPAESLDGEAYSSPAEGGPPAQSDIWGWFRGDSFVGSGTATGWNDKTGNGNHLTANGTPALSTDATLNDRDIATLADADRFQKDSGVSIAQPATISLKVKPNYAIGAAEYLFQSGVEESNNLIGLHVGYDDGLLNLFSMGPGGSLIQSSAIADDTWQRITVVINGASSAIYLDGVQVATGDMGTQAIVSPLALGQWLGDLTSEFNLNGSIAEAIIWDKALDSTERAALDAYDAEYFHGVTGAEADLSVTEAAEALSAAAAPTAVASLALTEAIETLSATGSPTSTADLSQTEQGEALAGVSSPTATAVASITEAAESLSVAASPTVVADAAIAEVAEGLSASGNSTVAGSLDLTEDGEDLDAVSAAGAALASLDLTEDGESLSAAGTPVASAASSITEADAALVAQGSPTATGALALTEPGETVGAAGTPREVGSLSLTEPGESLSASAVAESNDAEAALAVTEGAEALAASAAPTAVASLSLTEAGEALSASASGGSGLSLAVTEGGEALAASASSSVPASLALTEPAEMLSATAVVKAVASLNIVEEGETLSAPIGSITASLSLFEEGETLRSIARAVEPLAVDHCPTTLEEIVRSFAAKMPNGWAWDAASEPGTNMHQLLRGWSWVMKDIMDRACALLPEFVCHMTGELIPEWWADYGLPDDCGINDLCAKVRALGGANCAYFSDMADFLGYPQTCCEDLPIEIQAGGWDLGCQIMPPAPEFTGGGSLLGYAMLACPPDKLGADLGVSTLGDEDCNIVGYREGEAEVPEGSVCRTVLGCIEYVPPSVGVFSVGCPEPSMMKPYMGTAHHWKFGVPNSMAHLQGEGGLPWQCEYPQLCDDWMTGYTGLGTFIPGTDPTPGIYTITGCWEMGCAPLCEPPKAQLICFINELKPAHTVAIPYWCDEAA